MPLAESTPWIEPASWAAVSWSLARLLAAACDDTMCCCCWPVTTTLPVGSPGYRCWLVELTRAEGP